MSRYVKIEGSLSSSFTIFNAPIEMSAEDAIADGYKELVDEPPSMLDGYIVRLCQIEETSTQWIFHYEQIPVQKTAPNRKFSKYKIIQLCMKLGIWQGLKQELERSGLIDLFNAALVFKEDDTFFKQGLDIVKQKQGYDDEAINAFLDSCIADD